MILESRLPIKINTIAMKYDGVEAIYFDLSLRQEYRGNVIMDPDSNLPFVRRPISLDRHFQGDFLILSGNSIKLPVKREDSKNYRIY